MDFDWTTFFTTLFTCLGGTGLLSWGIQNHYKKNFLKFQKLYDKQVDLLNKTNDIIYELEQIIVDISREYLHMPKRSTEYITDALLETDKKISTLMNEFFSKSNNLYAFIQQYEAYFPKNFITLIYETQSKFQKILDEMCKNQNKDFDEKLNLWKKNIDTEWPQLRKVWIKEFRKFINK